MPARWIAAFLIAASACGKSAIERQYAKAASQQHAAAHGQADELTSVQKNGQAMNVTFFEQGERHVLIGADEGTADRRYRIDGGRPFLEASLWPNQFTVRTPDTKQLRRVVRLYIAGEIWIGDDANDGDGWRIVLGPGRAKVVDGSEHEAGTVTYDGKNTVVTDAANRVRFTKAGPALEPAYGVLLIGRIPTIERYVLIAELLARGGA